MNMNRIRNLFTGSSKMRKIRLLQSQRFLLAGGLDAFAEVMDTSLTEEKTGSLLTIRLWLKIKKEV